jgi:protein phosphatase
MQLTFPELSLVLLVGPSGCGKSTFARKHFRSSEIVSSDFYRGVVCDDEADQSASRDAFELVHQVVARRLAWKRFTVVDATNVQPEARKPLLELARRYHYLLSAIVFDLDEDICRKNNLARPNRTVPERVITLHRQHLKQALGALEREGIRDLHVFHTPEEMEAVTVRRVPLAVDRHGDHGPFDIIGDVHGCYAELLSLLERLDWRLIHQPDANGLPALTVEPPPGRRAVFVGDLGDRGPDTPAVYRLVMDLVRRGHALCVMGNHDNKLSRKLRGNAVQLTHGLAGTMEQLAAQPPEFTDEVRTFLDGLVSHYVLDDGKLVVAHAGLREDLQGRVSGKVRSFALFGDTTGESDELGLPVRLNWAADYRGKALVVYGHTPVAEPAWQNNTVNIDTGCVFGGRLTALRYPERETVSVACLRKYSETVRLFLGNGAAAAALSGKPEAQAREEKPNGVLDLGDVSGKRVIATRLLGNVVIPEANAAAALEVMSRWAANPRWLIYLPPTMSPCDTRPAPGSPSRSRRPQDAAPAAPSAAPAVLEHPVEAFAYYQRQGVPVVVCQEKHMGSRAVVIVCRDEAAARRAFAVEGEGAGIVYTRTGRRFFEDAALEAEVLARIREALTRAGTWDRFHTDWVCLDAELLPWSAKAQELLRTQYAAVAASGKAGLQQALEALEPLVARSEEAAALATCTGARREAIDRYRDAYRRYCWPVHSVTDLKLAPFHLLASAGAAHVDRPHAWHLEELARICQADGEMFRPTEATTVNVDDADSVQRGTAWWEALTARGGEGMVVKPADFAVRGTRGLVQPAVKCRGAEYLRLIYGPDYLAPEHLDRLRQRGLAAKRGLALREFALGVEALERFVRGEPLRRVHECCFAVLALESEPVDPRL